MFRDPGPLTRFLVLLCAFLLVVVPGREACAQADAFGQTPATGWQTSRLSQAVVNDANRAVETLIVARQTGQITAAMLQNAATSLRILYDHFQEIGLNAALQKQVLGDPDAFLNFHPNDSQVSAYLGKLAADGVTVPAAQVRIVMDPDTAMRQQFLSLIRSQGLYRAELQAVAQLQAQASELAASTSANRQSAHLARSSAHLMHVMSAVCWSCFILFGIGMITLCTVTAAACGGALATCLTCALGG
jgi:hypothetical protein